jgi:hypothetical protein
MTEDKYQAVIIAERAFGKIQVRQHSRKLARDLGLPADCMEPPTRRSPGRPRWIDDRLDRFDQETKRQVRLEAHYDITLPRAGDPVNLAATGV